MQVNSCDPCL